MRRRDAPRARWEPFRHADPRFIYEGAALRRHWPRLHRGDCEPFPDRKYLERLISAYPALKPALSVRDLADTLQEAWRAYHRGAFEEAADLGLSIGLLGYDVANKATNIHATYLARSEADAVSLFREAARRAEHLQRCAPTLANGWYFHAQALGRYSQRVSIGVAMAEGLADLIRTSLDEAIALQPRHADARIALGAFHAEIIAKMGSLVASITYGASKDAATENFDRALQLDPDSAIARIEYADALVSMYGRARRDQALRFLKEATELVPADAMEYLDIALAEAKLSG